MFCNSNNNLHICIVGGGAAGWIAFHTLKSNPRVGKITVISSPTIPKIGVGESTTMLFHKWLHSVVKLTTEEIMKFLVDIDASIKYGVSYENWGPRTFLHHFYTDVIHTTLSRYNLGIKPDNISHNKMAVPLSEHIYNNEVYISEKTPWLDRTLQGYTYHFDANKFIKACEKLAQDHPKLTFVSDDVVDSRYEGDVVKAVLLKSGNQVEADYFISCIGQTAFNQKVFNEEYTSYSDYLLTTKALFTPLDFTDPVAQFHPYTVARTMPHGWRWITPTRSRIGTGYVFSDNHVSVDEAVNDFRKDAGIPDLEPFVVDFFPRKVKHTFKTNMCTLGMASGFLEPLDAPGLTLIHLTLEILQHNLDNNNYNYNLEDMNEESADHFNFWCAFILHQYKTCHRSDTDFWKDHKSVKCNFYDAFVETLFDMPFSIKNSPGTKVSVLNINQIIRKEIYLDRASMFLHTTSGKDIKWDVSTSDNTTPCLKKYIDKTRIMTHRKYFDTMVKHVHR